MVLIITKTSYFFLALLNFSFYIYADDTIQNKVKKIYIRKNKNIPQILYKEITRSFFSLHDTKYRLVTRPDKADRVLELTYEKNKASLKLDSTTLNFNWPKKLADRQKVVRFECYKLLHGEENLKLIQQKSWFQRNLNLQKRSKSHKKAVIASQAQKAVDLSLESKQKAQKKNVAKKKPQIKNTEVPPSFDLSNLDMSIYLQQNFISVKDREFSDTDQASIDIAIGAQVKDYHLYFTRRSMSIIEQQDKVYTQNLDSLRFRHKPKILKHSLPQKMRSYVEMGYMISLGSMQEKVRSINKEKTYSAISLDFIINKSFQLQIGYEQTDAENSPFIAVGIGYNL